MRESDIFSRGRPLSPHELLGAQSDQRAAVAEQLHAAHVDLDALVESSRRFSVAGEGAFKHVFGATDAEADEASGALHPLTGRDIAFVTSLSPFWRSYTSAALELMQRNGVRVGVDVPWQLAEHAAKQLSRIADLALFVEWKRFQASETGRDGRGQFEEFERSLLSGGWRTVFEHYPVLARYIDVWLANSLAALQTFCERLRDDWILLKRDFSVADAPLIGAIRQDLSDPHNRGQTVIQFDPGGGASLFYKPRSIGNEAFFFSRLAPHIYGANLFSTATVAIDRVSYGWMRDLSSFKTEVGQCADPHYHAGRLAGMMHFFRAGDLHFENLFDVNGYLTPIDLEVMWCGTALASGRGAPQDNILSTGLFSLEASLGEDAEDISGLFAEKFRAFYPSHSFDRPNSDAMAITFDRPSVQVSRPKYLENAGATHARLADGFADMYREILSRRDVFTDLVEESGACRSRIVIRPTATYTRILQKLRQPKYLRSNLETARELMQLFRIVGQAPESNRDRIEEIITAEYLALSSLDIPAFYFKPSDVKPIGLGARVYAVSGSEAVKLRLSQASEVGLNTELGWIRASQRLSSLSSPGDEHADVSGEEARASNPIDPSALAAELARNLLAAHHTGPDGLPRWIGLELRLSDNRVVPSRTGDTFYSGFPGPLLFLALAEQSRRKAGGLDSSLVDFLSRSAAAYVHVLQSAPEPSRGGVLGIEGAGGELLALSGLVGADAATWKPVLALAMTRSTAIDPTLCAETDVISGLAGFIAGLSNAIRAGIACGLDAHLVATASNRLEQASQRLFDMREAVSTGGSSWRTIADEPLLPGFAHGSAGIRTALLMAHAIRPQTWTRDCIDEVRAFERSVRGDPNLPWLDRRTARPPKDRRNHSWCHGLAGLGFAECFQAMTGFGDVASCLENTDMIARAIAERERESMDNYCCGEAGVIDFLFCASKVLGDQGFAEVAERRLSALMLRLTATRRMDSYIGPMEANYLPGLFQGWAGIGLVTLGRRDANGRLLGALNTVGSWAPPHVRGSVVSSAHDGRGL